VNRVQEDRWPIGVFASIDAGLGVHLDVVQELHIPTIQLHAPHATSRTPARARAFVDELSGLGIRLTAVFGGFEGESYADIPTVERTVGLVPVATRAARLAEMKEISDFTRLLDCPVVALHLGFVPHDRTAKEYQSVVDVTRELCNHAQNNGQKLHLETGQETAEALVAFMDDVARPNLYVNFDPANMILYGTGEPMSALRQLGTRVQSVHCKDGLWAKNPGDEWGQEVPLGQGNVGMERYLRTLKDLGYFGPLTIEREIPQERQRQKQEIAGAVQLLTSLRAKLLGSVP
jgi:sugar phosphate isomerase/epimerase